MRLPGQADHKDGMTQQRAALPTQRAAVALIAAAFAILGLIYSLTTPIFEAPDELYHFAYVRYVAERGALPVQGARAGEEAAQQEASQPPLYYLLAAPLARLVDTSDFAAVAHNPFAAPGLPHNDGNKNVVLHGAGESFPYQGTVLAVHLVRLLSLALGLVSVLAVYLAARLIFPGRPALALLSMAVAAFNPQFLFIHAAINNDNLMTALGSLTFVVLLFVATRPRPPRVWLRDALLLGVLAGLAALAKLTGVLLLGFVVLSLTLLGWRKGQLRRSLLQVAVIGALAAVLAGWWYARNWLLYGDVTGLNAMLAWVGERQLAPAALRDEIQGLELSFWGVFGWFNILADQAFYAIAQYTTRLALVGLAGLGLTLWLRRRPGPARPSLVDGRALALAALWALLVVTGLLGWTSTTPGSQGRLLFPAMAALAPLLVAGLAALLGGRWQTPLLTGLTLALAVVAIVTPARYIGPAYARPVLLASAQAAPQHPAALAYGGQIALLGYSVYPDVTQPGQTVSITLYLQAVQPMQANYSLYIHVWGRGMEWLGQVDSYPGRGSYPTSQWQPGVVIEDRYLVTVAPTATVPARAQIEVGFYDYASRRRQEARAPDGQRVPLPIIGRLKVASGEPAPALLPARYSFAGQINLTEARLAPPGAPAAGQELTVETTWQTTAPPPADYTIFMQLLDGRGEIVAQADGQPQGGEYPTGLWSVGEVVHDSRRLALPAGLPAGRYRLVAGLYVLATQERLPITAGPGDAADRALLAEIDVR